MPSSVRGPCPDLKQVSHPALLCRDDFPWCRLQGMVENDCKLRASPDGSDLSGEIRRGGWPRLRLVVAASVRLPSATSRMAIWSFSPRIFIDQRIRHLRVWQKPITEPRLTSRAAGAAGSSQSKFERPLRSIPNIARRTCGNEREARDEKLREKCQETEIWNVARCVIRTSCTQLSGDPCI